MEHYINRPFLEYVASFFGINSEDPNYNSSLGVNNDGVIDVSDVAWFAKRYETWVNLPDQDYRVWIASRPRILKARPSPSAPSGTREEARRIIREYT